MGPAVPGPIPWQAVRDWCEFHGLPGAAVPELDALIGAMEAVYFDWWRAQRPVAGDKGKGAG